MNLSDLPLTPSTTTMRFTVSDDQAGTERFHLTFRVTRSP
ncbi:hypothetical protein C791_2766 [Amycolatopsis azurea DSM 43854]|uniref:Uncharacterized protein n=1 Tax=Amycolatopsis azurea DSM 43854 TaxID=1238180 RepID=M2QJU5_9PSEU|nr:hypothetical protein C791_2766 [Amycolatopsis azurea DSM 43854]